MKRPGAPARPRPGAEPEVVTSREAGIQRRSPQAREHRVEPGQAGTTISAVVRAMLDEVPWSKARELCRTGRVWVDGAAIHDGAARVRAGQQVVVDPGAARLGAHELPPGSIVHLDPDVIVVAKPAGIVTTPFEPGERDTLVHAVGATVRRIEKARGRPPLGVRVVQRLDKDTSGVLVFARHRAAERELQAQLKQRTTERRYLALVVGQASSRTFDTLLVEDRGDGLRGSWRAPPRHPMARPPEDAKRAVTHVELLETYGDPLDPAQVRASLVACRLETGRQHQIRIHLAEAGHPLLGEPIYARALGQPVDDALLARVQIAARPLLHALQLGFRAPGAERGAGPWMRFEVPPPADFEAMLAALRERRPLPRLGPATGSDAPAQPRAAPRADRARPGAARTPRGGERGARPAKPRGRDRNER